VDDVVVVLAQDGVDVRRLMIEDVVVAIAAVDRVLEGASVQVVATLCVP
jgi:hypothetical protein